MTVEWFVDNGGPVVETAWGHHQDVPIFRALAIQHNVGLAVTAENRAFRKALLIQAIAASDNFTEDVKKAEEKLVWRKEDVESN